MILSRGISQRLNYRLTLQREIKYMSHLNPIVDVKVPKNKARNEKGFATASK